MMYWGECIMNGHQIDLNRFFSILYYRYIVVLGSYKLDFIYNVGAYVYFYIYLFQKGF